MIRNLKALGLAIVAVLAMGAVAASSASAQSQGTLTSDGPVTLLGTQTGAFESKSNALTAFGGRVECEKVVYTGHKWNQTPHVPVPVPTKTVTLTPHYEKCFTFLGANKLPMTVDMTSCDFVLELGETTEAGDTYGINATVKCNVPKDVIHVTVFLEAGHVNKVCDITIIPDEAKDYKGLHATDTTNGHIDITGTITEITATKTPKSLLCNPHEHAANAKLDLDVTVEGRNEAGGTTSISLSHP